MADTPGTTPRGGRWWRWLLGVVVVVGVAVVVLTQTPQGQRWARDVALSALEDLLAPGWTLDDASLSWAWDGRIIAEGIVLRDPEGTPVISARRLDGKLTLGALLSRDIAASSLRLDGVRVALSTDADGVLNVVRAFGGPSEPDLDAEPWGGLPVGILADDVGVRDAMVSLWGPPDADGVRSGWALKVLSLEGALTLPRQTPKVQARDLALHAVVLHPGPAVASLTGAGAWTGDGVTLDDARLQVDGAAVGVRGEVRDLFGAGQVDAAVTADRLDLTVLDRLLGTNTAGVYAGALTATGTLAALDLLGSLRGVEGTRGTLTVREGTRLCLPTGSAGPDACSDGTVDGDAPLRWRASLGVEALHLEDALPSIGGPLRLQGDLEAHGAGTTWPDDVRVDGGRVRLADLDVYGVPIRRGAAGVRLRDGRLVVSGADVEAVAGTLQGDATLDLTDGALSVVASGTLDPTMLADVGVDGLGGAGTYEARVSGRVFDEGAPLDLEGTFDARPVTWGSDLIVGHLWGHFDGHIEGGVTDVQLQAEGTDGFAYGADLPAVVVPSLSVRVADGAVTLEGEAVAPRVDYGRGVRVERIATTFDLRRPADGDLMLRADADVGPHDLFGLLGNQGDVALTLDGDQLWLDTDLRWDDLPFIRAPALRMDLATQEIDLETLVFQPTARQRWTLTTPLHLKLVPGGVADAAGELASPLGRIAITGDLATEGTLAGAVSLKAVQLDALAEMFPEWFNGLAGRVDAELTALGRAKRPNLALTVDAEDLFWEDRFRYLDLKGRLGVVDDVANVRALASVADAPFVRVQGYVPVHADLSNPRLSVDGDADVDVLLEPGHWRRVSQLVPGVQMPDGEASGVLDISGDIHDPDLQLQLVTDVSVPQLSERVRAELDLTRVDGALTVALDGYRGFEPVLRTDGAAQTRLSEVMDWLLAGADAPDFSDLTLFASDLDVIAWLDGFPLVTLQELSGAPLDLGGEASGVVRIAGQPQAPEVTVDLEAQALLADQEARVAIGLKPEAEGYGVDLRIGDEGTDWLAASGQVPMAIDLSAPFADWGTSAMYAIDIGGEGMPLSVLRVFDRGVRDASGTVALSGDVGGPWRDPAPNVSLDVTNGSLAYLPAGIALRAVNARLHTDRALDASAGGSVTLVLDDLSAQSRPITASLERITAIGESRVHAEGAVDLDGWNPEGVRGTVRFSDTWLFALDDMQARVSGALDVTGTWPGVRLTGNLGVNQGSFALNTTDLLASRTMQLSPWIRVFRGETTSQTTLEDGLAWFDEVEAWISVDLGRNTNMRLRAPLFDDLGAFAQSLTRADIEARLGGRLQVGMQDGDVSVVGDVEALSGRVDVLRGKFDLLAGSRISFLGEDYANPQLDITGAMGVSGGQIGMTLRGPAAEPTFTFTSDDFGSDAAIFTILLTGRAPDELSADQGRSAIEAVSDLLFNSVLGGVTLGSVSVEADGTVIVGLPVYRTVFLETAYSPAPRLNENNVRVEAEWSILPRLLLNASYGDRLVTGDILYEVRLTTVCDRLRKSYVELGGDGLQIEGRCKEVRRAVQGLRAAQDASAAGDAEADR